MSKSLEASDLLLLLEFDATHLGRTKQLAAFNETVASLQAQPFRKQAFIDQMCEEYKCPTQEDVVEYLASKKAAPAEAE